MDKIGDLGGGLTGSAQISAIGRGAGALRSRISQEGQRRPSQHCRVGLDQGEPSDPNQDLTHRGYTAQFERTPLNFGFVL